MRKCESGRLPDGFAAQHRGFSEASKIDEHRGEIAARQYVIGRALDARAKFALRFLEAQQLVQRAGEIVARVAQLRVEFDRPAITVDRVGAVTLVAQDVAEVAPRQRVLWKSRGEGAQQGRGVCMLAQHGKRIGRAQVELHIARIETACFAKRRKRFGVAFVREISLREIARHPGVIAALMRRALEIIHGRRGLAELQQGYAKQMQRIRVLGRYRERLPVSYCGCPQVTLIVGAQPGLEVGMQLIGKRH